MTNKRAAYLVLTLLLAGLAWGVVTAMLFGMWVSFAIGLGAAAFVVARRNAGLVPTVLLAAVATPLVLAQFALPELAAELDDISCRVRAAQGVACADAPAIDLDATGPLLSARRHAAIRWFNANMAIGGWVAGFGETSWETWKLDELSTPALRQSMQSKPMRERRAACREGADKDGASLRREGDFVLDAAAARAATVKLANSTRDGQERWVRLPLRGGYGQHPWHVVLALWVPGAKLHAKRAGDTLHMSWRGGLHYPTYTLGSVQLPRPIGDGYSMTIDESFFCGAQMDGVFAPYQLEWFWDMSVEEARNLDVHDERRLFEHSARALPL